MDRHDRWNNPELKHCNSATGLEKMQKYCGNILGGEAVFMPETLRGNRVIRLLASMHDLFEPHLEAIQKIDYDPKFHQRADKAIEGIASAPYAAKEASINLRVLRVLMERHAVVTMANQVLESSGRFCSAIPKGLTDEQQGAALLFALMYDYQVKVEENPAWMYEYTIQDGKVILEFKENPNYRENFFRNNW